MKLLRLLIKPKWQHKDAAVRRDAVASLRDPELESALPRLLREDPDAGVRLAALRRLDAYELWRERSTADADAELRQRARSAYLQRLLHGAPDAPGLERRIAELDTLSGDELEAVLVQAEDRALRAAALERVRRPALLLERAASDPDPALRLAALARIDEADALARLAERTRKTDKTISRLAREKHEAARIAAGDAEAIAQRARQLCERAEALLQRPRGERAHELAAIDAAWAELAARAPAALAERLAGTLGVLRSDTDAAAAQRERLRTLRPRLDDVLAQLEHCDAGRIEPVLAEATAALNATAAELPERAAVEQDVTRLAQRLASLAAQGAAQALATPQATDPALSGDPAALAAQARFEASLAAAQEESRRERERQGQRRRELDADVRDLEHLLEGGDVAGAHAVHARIEAALGELPETARHDKRLLNVQARYAELARWQHWSNNEQRKRLCDAVEALAGSGLHPDAVASRVRELRAEWQRLDASEGLPATEKGQRPTQGLARRFHALCNQALKPARGYFDKRDELRKAHEQVIAALIERAGSANESADRATCSALRGEVVAALRQLDGVDPRQRKALAQRLKDALGRIDTRLDALNAAVVETKRALIARAERAAQQSDRGAAARELRELQQRWKEAGSARRRDDQALWNDFRAVCDRVFGELDTQRRERAEREAAGLADAQAAVEALEALRGASVEEVRARRRELTARWADLDCRDRALVARWQRAAEALDAAEAARARQQRDAVFTAALARLRWCERCESSAGGSDAGPSWDELPAVSGELAAALQARRESAVSGATQPSPHAEDLARQLLVQMEFLAGGETPPEDRQLRMDWQVARLSQRLGQGAALAPREELHDVLLRWVRLGPLTGSAATALRQRFERAFGAALDRLP